AFFNFQANIDQSAETINGIKLMISFIPAIAALLSGVFMYFYQLSESKVKEITTTLETKREEMEND
ncbi:MAG TPA: MFS transporter, partial [Bacteroidales bacterium]|nr:MFS transporter [Bacteroidales bacterium]